MRPVAADAVLVFWFFFFSFRRARAALRWLKLHCIWILFSLIKSVSCEICIWILAFSGASHSRAWCCCGGREALAAVHTGLQAAKMPWLLLKELQKSTGVHTSSSAPETHAQQDLSKHKESTWKRDIHGQGRRSRAVSVSQKGQSTHSPWEPPALCRGAVVVLWRSAAGLRLPTLDTENWLFDKCVGVCLPLEGAGQGEPLNPH